jgi:glyoxylate reductase
MKVFVTCPLPGDAVERLRAACEVVVGEPGRGVRSAAFVEQASTFDALVTLLTDAVDDALLASAPRVRLVANVAVGVDNVDLAACRARGVAVTNTPGVLTEATADLAFGLLIAAARRIAEGDAVVRRGEFPGWTPTTLLGAPVFGASLGIVGLGRIGQAVARRARGFGMHVFYTQRRRLDPALERALGASFVPLDELFRSCDFVTLHCPLTPATRHLASRERLATMKPGSVLVNTSRGPCVDEAALADALERGPLGAAGIDVFEREPAVEARLLARRNAVLTPHVGSADRRTREAMAGLAADNVLALARSQPLLTPVSAPEERTER